MELPLQHHLDLVQISALLRQQLLELIAVVDELLDLAIVEIHGLVASLNGGKMCSY